MDTNILEEMNLIKNIALILNIDEVDLFIKESLYNVEILSNIPDNFSVKSENILLFNDLIKDDFQIDFLYCNISEKTLNKNFNISDVYEFIEIINDKLEDLDYTDDEDRQVIDSFKIKIYIRKEIKEQILNVYDFEALCEYWDKLSWKDRLSALANPKLIKGVVFFLHSETVDAFNTDLFYFTNDTSCKPRYVDYIEEIRDNAYWSKMDLYPFSPIYFYCIQRPNVENAFVKSFDILSVVFSLCTLFDITSLDNNILKFKLCGYKNVSGVLNLENTIDISQETRQEYYKIFKWVYVGEGNKADKIGIVRNILSLFILNDNINIQENVLFSIKSSFKTYLKENLDKYVSIRNQIYQELDSIINLSSIAKKDFLDGFKNNLLACISFFFSTLVMNLLGGSSINNSLFSKDVVLLSYAIFFISFLYMIWMRNDINNEKKNISKRYKILKERYSDLLINEEIDAIFRHGEELEEQIDYIDGFKKQYSILWSISLFILFLVVTILSDYNGDFDFLSLFIKRILSIVLFII